MIKSLLYEELDEKAWQWLHKALISRDDPDLFASCSRPVL
jgi:hypothetical protein